MADRDTSIKQGATVSDLSVLFGLDRKQVRERLGDAAPIGKRSGNDTWRVKDVASRLVNLGDDHAELVSRVLALHHTQLPKMLSREYWAGQSNRLRVLKEMGELWDTAAVVELASTVFKSLRLSLMLAADTVERQVGLTVEQRDIIEKMMSAVLEQVRGEIDERLTQSRNEVTGKTFAPQESGAGAGNGDGDELYDLGLADEAEDLGLV